MKAKEFEGVTKSLPITDNFEEINFHKTYSSFLALWGSVSQTRFTEMELLQLI